MPDAPLTPVCPFCGEPYHTADHIFRCDGRQGHVDAWEPYANVRTSDPDTSHAAVLSLGAIEITINQQRVYDILRSTGRLTDEEILQEYRRRHGPCAESTPRKRRCDLVKMGLVKDSDERRLLVSGRFGIVWQLVQL